MPQCYTYQADDVRNVIGASEILPLDAMLSQTLGSGPVLSECCYRLVVTIVPSRGFSQQRRRLRNRQTSS